MGEKITVEEKKRDQEGMKMMNLNISLENIDTREKKKDQEGMIMMV